MSLVINRIQEHYQYASQFVDADNIIGCFCCGSQNYGTDMPFSDVDTKLLITPTLDDIYHDKKAESSTKTLPDGSNEQVVIKDIRQAIHEIKKQNTNILELLYTDFYILNPVYQDIYEKLISRRDEIARYNPKAAVKSIYGNSMNTYNRLYKEDQSINQKQVANLVRYEYYVNKYVMGLSYIECLRPDLETVKYIKQIRSGEMGANSLMAIADNCINQIQKEVDDYCDRTDIPPANDRVEDFLNEVRKDFIDASFFMEYAKRGDL
jgi:predicted nucleotidyltransferase